MADAQALPSPFVGLAPCLPPFADGFNSTTAGKSTPRIRSRASLLKKPFEATLNGESSIVKRLFSFKSYESVHQPSQDAAATVEAEDADGKGARRASKRNTIFKAVIKKWLATRKDTPRTPEILKRNDSKNSSRTSDDITRKPPPDIPYSRLIEEALLYSGKASLSAKEICKHIMDNYRWYKDNHRDAWQVGHSMHVMPACRTLTINSTRVTSSKSCLETLVSKLYLSVAEDVLARASSGA
jgi:hypothetical protein